MANSESACCALCRQEEECRFASEEFGHSPLMVRLVVFFGILSTVTGIIECIQGIDPFRLEGRSIHYKIPGKLLLFTGSLLTTASLVTIVEAGKLMRISIFSLLQILNLVLFLETIAGSAAFAFCSSASNGHFNRSLLQDLEKEYYRDQLVTLAWDRIQATFNCCGVRSPQDWSSSYWSEKKADNVTEYPLSCCEQQYGCNRSTVTRQGCGGIVTEALRHHLIWVYMVAFSSILVHVTSYLALSFLEKYM